MNSLLRWKIRKFYRRIFFIVIEPFVRFRQKIAKNCPKLARKLYKFEGRFYRVFYISEN